MRRRDHYWSLYRMSDKKQFDDFRTDYVEAVFEVLTDQQRADFVIWGEGLSNWKPLSDFPQILRDLRRLNSATQTGTQAGTQSELQTGGQSSFASVSASSMSASSMSASSIDDQTDVLSGSRYSPSTHQSQNMESGPRGGPSARGGGENNSYLSREDDQQAHRPNLEATTIASAIAQRLSAMEKDNDGQTLELEEVTNTESRRATRVDRAYEVKIVAGDQAYPNETVNISMSGMKLREPLPSDLPQYFAVEIFIGDKVIPVVCSGVKVRGERGITRLRIEVNEYAALLQNSIFSG